PRRIAFELGERREPGDREHPWLQAARSRDLPPARRQIAGDVAGIRFGADHLDGDDRLEHDGPGFLDRVEERLLAGGDERDLFRIDWVMLAVVDDHADILQW